MGIRYENLDQVTRFYVHEEWKRGDFYRSSRLTEQGLAAWPELLKEALLHHNDDWLSAELLQHGYIRSHEEYTREGVTRSRRINQLQAAEQLAEGEFNRYYLRGLCLRAKSEGKETLIVYRGKEVRQPRAESQAKLGTSIAIDTLLDALRANDFVTIEDAIGVPGGPNSGLTCKLP